MGVTLQHLWNLVKLVKSANFVKIVNQIKVMNFCETSEPSDRSDNTASNQNFIQLGEKQIVVDL